LLGAKKYDAHIQIYSSFECRQKTKTKIRKITGRQGPSSIFSLQMFKLFLNLRTQEGEEGCARTVHYKNKKIEEKIHAKSF